MLETFQQHWLQNSQVPTIHIYLPLCRQINDMIRVHWWAPAAPHLQQIMPEGNQSSASKYTHIVPDRRNFTFFQMTLASANHEWTLLWCTAPIYRIFLPMGATLLLQIQYSFPNFAFRPTVNEREVRDLLRPWVLLWLLNSPTRLIHRKLKWWWCLRRCWMLWDMVSRL